jgi:hypothetical protein
LPLEKARRMNVPKSAFAIEAEASVATEHAKELAAHYLVLLDAYPDAKSYLEMTLHDAQGRAVIVTVRRGEGETPGEKAARHERRSTRLSTKLRAIKKWAQTYGAELCPEHTGSADTYGEGVRACKAAVMDLLTDQTLPPMVDRDVL